jgi:hypothetical protein
LNVLAEGKEPGSVTVTQVSKCGGNSIAIVHELAKLSLLCWTNRLLNEQYLLTNLRHGEASGGGPSVTTALLIHRYTLVNKPSVKAKQRISISSILAC